MVADRDTGNRSVSFAGGRFRGILSAALDTIVRSPRSLDGFPMDLESVRRRPSAIFPGRLSALVMAMSISLQHARSIDWPRFWWASINRGAESDELTLTSVAFPWATWARGPGLSLGALKYQYGPSKRMTTGLDARPVAND